MKKMRQSEIKRLLPDVFQRTLYPESPLAALLEVMEALHQPTEETLDQIEFWFSPYSAPDRFVEFLAGWLDLDRLFPSRTNTQSMPNPTAPPISSGFGRLRELIAAAVYLSQWRGTSTGLRCFLETATGVAGFELEERVLGTDGVTRPFHFRVWAPEATAQHRTLIERIIQQEKPAYVTYELVFGPPTENAKALNEGNSHFGDS